MSPSHRPTIADVAALAGTSTAVVSYVVNGGPRSVADATKERVERAIAELGYRRNPLAGALSAGSTELIGLIVPDSANAFFSELARHVEGEARERGLLTLLGNTAYSPSAERDYLAAFSDLRPRGILVATISPERAMPVDRPRVFLHSAPDDAEPRVATDDEAAAAMAVRHLLDDGYTDIHCVTGPSSFGPAGLREAGWRRAMAEAHLDAAGRLHRMSFDRLAAERSLRELLAAGSRPRAIFTTTDEQGIAAVRVASELGLRLPRDLAICGFDGIREALSGSVHLTTVAVPLHGLAVAALDAVDAIRAGEAPHARILPSELRVGETCGPH